MELYSFINLLTDRFPWNAVARMKGRVVAIRAAAKADRPVAVRARETCINDKFLKPLTVNAAVPSSRGVISFAFGKVEHGPVLLSASVKLRQKSLS